MAPNLSLRKLATSLGQPTTGLSQAQLAAGVAQAIGRGTLRFALPSALLGLGLTDGQTVTLDAMTGTTGGGIFVWKASSTAAVNGGGVLAATDTSTGRFFRQAHLLGIYSPEDFGAVGDDTNDDYSAFMRLAAAVNAAKNATIRFAAGAKYYYDRRILLTGNRANGDLTDPWKDAPKIFGFGSVVLEGNGATIRVQGGYQRRLGTQMANNTTLNLQTYNSPDESLSGLIFAYGQNLRVSNLTLDGNARTTTRAGTATKQTDGYFHNGSFVAEGYSHGLQLWGIDDAALTNVHASDFQSDGFFIGHSEVYGPDGTTSVASATRTLCHRVSLTNCTATSNRRNNASVTGARILTATNCDFDMAGVVSVAGDGSYVQDAYGFHDPGAGIDIEPSTYPGNPDPTYRVPEMTGSMTFIGCRFRWNWNGPFVATYTNKIDGGIRLIGCEIDGAKETAPDAYVVAAPGVTFDGCTIRLGRNGFLWLDTTAAASQLTDNLGCRIINGKIYLTDQLGYRRATNPSLPLEISGNKIFYPAAITSNGAAMNLLDRGTGTYGIGGNKEIVFKDNHMYIPYSYSTDLVNGDAVALLEGLGQVSRNTWELTGTRPNNRGVDATYQVIYYSNLGGSNKRWDTKPVNETFVQNAAAPNGTDLLCSTPAGFKFLSTFSYKDAGYIPFGLSGTLSAGTFTVALGVVAETTIVTGLTGKFTSNFNTGLTATLTAYINGTQKMSASFTAGSPVTGTVTGANFTVNSGDILKVTLTYANTGGTDMADLAGFLATQST